MGYRFSEGTGCKQPVPRLRVKGERMSKNPVAVAYIRVSTHEQATYGVSLAAQRERVEAYARLAGLKLAKVIADEGVSATKPLAERPGGRELLELAKTGKVGHVVVLKLDRLFRNAIDALETISEWDRRGVALHLVDQGGAAINTKSAVGKMFFTLLAAFAEMERNLISERTKSALEHKRNNLEVYSPTPLGFQRQGDRLVPDPQEEKTVRLILTLRGQGYSYRAIAAELRRRRIPTKRGGKWEAATVRRVVLRVQEAPTVTVMG